MKLNHYVEDWLSAVAESSRTERKYIENTVAFAEFARGRGQDFYSIVDVWRKVKASSINEREEFLDVWMDIVRSFHTQLKRKYAPLVIKNFLATTKSFLKFWDIPVRVRLPRHACVIYHNRDITKEELRQILTFASPRDRVIWLVMAESGMRVSTAINMRYGQIREDVEADKIPMRIMLPSASLKDHVGDRWSFIGEDGVRELKEYLRRRLPLDDDELVFASEKPGKVVGDQFSVSSLSIKFSRIVKKLGLAKPRGTDQKKPKSVRQHCLRKYFRNNIRVEQAYRKFWEGRGLGSDEHYISRDVEKHRRKYREGYPYLRIYDIEPMIRREDIESIVEARVKERLAQRRQEQAQEIERLQSQVQKLTVEKLSPEDVEMLRRILTLINEGKITIKP